MMKLSRARMLRFVVPLAVVGLLPIGIAVAQEVSPPFWTECVKAPKGTGVYPNKSCQIASAPGKGKFVIKEGLGKGKALKGHLVHSQAAVLEVSNPLAAGGITAITCKSTKTSGTYALPNLLAHAQLTLGKCSFGKQACTSPTASPGEIRTAALRGEYGYTETRLEEQGDHKVIVGVRLENEADPGGPITTFVCGSELEGVVSNQVIFKVPQPDLFFSRSGLLNAEAYGGYGFLEQELAGHKFVPRVDFYVGWADELAEIEAGTKRPHVLEVELCGPYIEGQLGTRCTPRLYAGLELRVDTNGEGLMLETPDSFADCDESICRTGGP